MRRRLIAAWARWGMVDTVLIFPASSDAVLDFAESARCRGDCVVGASSLPHDPLRAEFEHWEFLPYFDHPEFESRLRDVIERCGVTLIHTGHLVVWQTLAAMAGRLPESVRLDAALPWHADLRKYRRQFARAAALDDAGSIAADGPARPALSLIEKAALPAIAEAAPGWCSVEKVLMLAEMFRYVPLGDLVEIGVFCGKSAGVLAWLARRWKIGALLCIDPWSDSAMVQDNAAVNKATATLDFDEIFQIFLTASAWIGRDEVMNYLRMSSDQAFRIYCGGVQIDTPEFGGVKYSGKIAVLHIDGNHDEAQVRRDVEQWAALVVPGGWIVIDDYVHAFGAGPRKIGDEFLTENAGRIAASLVSGSALFIQLAGAPAPACP